MAAYHKGYTIAERKAVDAKRKRSTRKEATEKDILTKDVIVWDGEGMKLSGDDMPQHYVLFGCSAEPDSPLVITEPDGRLTFKEIADYCLSIVKRHPHAIHLGYFFKYDQNMIIWSLPWVAKTRLYGSGMCSITYGKAKYYVRIVFGKTIRITRVIGTEKLSILIEDFAPFFASSFVKAYEKLFPVPTDPENWAVVVQGKADRSDMLYVDMPKVIRYWKAEIIALQELAQEFRRLMFNANFMLTQWHGPGALANYIRRRYDLVRHEWGGKEENLPPEVHKAARGGFYGGRFEPYQIGFIRGPIYSYDINSAYPFAFCHIPSLAEGGNWRHVGAVSRERWESDGELQNSFAVFHVRWAGETSHPNLLANRIIQPLPHRSPQSTISYPQFVSGWYWSPEVQTAMGLATMRPKTECVITDCWKWEPAEEIYPWEDVIREMYGRRRVLQKANNPTQMAFKLGPNSMYGKMAQRAGGKVEPPKSHTLPIAGFITSLCRSLVMRMMMACGRDNVISVETDGVYTTTPPDKLRGKAMFPLGKDLGEWGVDTYDNMILIQNGVYLLQKDGVWLPPKSRGIPAEAVKIDEIQTFLSQCMGDRWPLLKFHQKESFIGLGTSIARNTIIRQQDGKRSLNPARANKIHCTWKSDPREIDIEGHKSKRQHIARWCRACHEGLSPADTAHYTFIRSPAFNPALRESSLYDLPWQRDYVEPQWVIAAKADAEVEID